MLLSLRSRDGLRRTGAILAGLLLATGAMAGSVSADVGKVTITSNQSPNPVAGTGSATYSIRVVNDSWLFDRYFRVTDISHATLSASFTPAACVKINHVWGGSGHADLTLTVTTAGTPPGSHSFFVTVTDYDTSSDCANDHHPNSDEESNTVTIYVGTPLTVTGPTLSRTYGAVNPTLTPTYSGFTGGDTSASLTTEPTCTTTAVPTSPPGDYPVTCSGGVSSKYVFSYVAGKLTVGQATLTITASSGTMTEGGTPPVITPIYSGWVNGDTAASLTTPPTCTTTATSSSAVGTYPSTCSGAVDPNYTISYVAGTVTVSAKPILTITASSATMVFGNPVPAITPGYSGWVEGDTVASLTTPPTCTTTATSSSLAGTYPSTCSGAVDPKYTIVYVAGTVTVTGTQSVLGATAAPTATPPPTSTGSGSSGNSSIPLIALMICVAFGGIGLGAFEAQRRTIRR